VLQKQFDRASEVYQAALAAAKTDEKYNLIGIAREVSRFYGAPDVNRPEEGASVLTTLMRERDSLTDKAQLEIYLAQFLESQGRFTEAQRQVLMAVTHDPSANVLMSAAEYFARTNRLRDAVEYYQRALEANPADERLLRARIVSLLLAMRDLERAKVEVDRYVQSYPDDQQGFIFLGTYHMIGGDIEEAERAFHAELEKHPDNPVALWQRGQLYSLKGRWQAAVEDLSRAKAIQPEAFNYQHRIALADALVELNRGSEAISDLKSILDQAPREKAVAAALVDVYIRVRPSRYADAERIVRTYMADYPKDESWPMLLGRLGQYSQNKSQEVEGYARAAEVSEFQPAAIKALFNALRNAGRPDEVIRYAQEVLSERRLDQIPNASAALGWAYHTIKRDEPAWAAYDRALEGSAGDFGLHASIISEMVGSFGKDAVSERLKSQADAAPADLRRQKSWLFMLWLENRQEDAARVATRILESADDDQDRVFALVGLATFSEGAGRLEEAKKHYEAALAIDPNHGVALNNLAYLLAKDLKKPIEALPYAERAVRVNPNSVDVLDTLGFVLAENGRTGEAVTRLLQALDLDRFNTTAIFHLGMVHKMRGEREEARRRLNDAREFETKRLLAMKQQTGQDGTSDILPKIDKALEELK
jgi:tetratricopeptide (TPR) repeat protein